MSEKCTIGNPGTAYEAFSKACAESPLNETVRRINHNYQVQQALSQALAEMGMTRFINLTNRSDQGLIAQAYYVGDGLVAKIIPRNYLGESNAIYHVPSIVSREVRIETRDFVGEEHLDEFVIKIYPWISPGHIEQSDVESFTRMVNAIGITINEGDAAPKNIHRLPLLSNRMVGIDSSMYNLSNARITPQQENGWHNFMHLLYPIYETDAVPPQTEKTNFKFISIHDRAMEDLEFDDATGALLFPPELLPPSRRAEVKGIFDALMRRLRGHATDKPTMDI